MNQTPSNDKWLEEHWDALYRYALTRIRDETLAEDLVQETLLAAFKNHQQFERRSTAKTWLIGILKHKIIDAIRKASREVPFSHDENLLTDTLADSYFDNKQHWQIDLENWSAPEKALEQQQFWDVLEECIDRLPPRMAQIFILRELDGLSSKEICKVTALSSTNNLWVNLSRIRMRMRECLGSRWFTLNSGG